MNETTLNPRQKQILNILQSQSLKREEVAKALLPFSPVSKATLIRDLGRLIAQKFIKAKNRGPKIYYELASIHPLLKPIDLDAYFLLDPDKRINSRKTFDFGIFEKLRNLFTQKERTDLKTIYKNFNEETKKLEPSILKKELERFTIELSWKSSKIEGNTYSLLETEGLIKQNREALGHPKEEALMILNHKKALEQIVKNKNDFKELNLSKISQLHNILVKDLSIPAGVRRQKVGVTGTTYTPLDNQWQIKEALQKTIDLINRTTYPLEKALIALALISYIQPFADGNKRTARLLANALLLAFNFYPLSYRGIDEVEYKKALILFYEQENLLPLKKMFTEQYLFALKTYFR